MARMIGRKAGTSGCPHGKRCECNGAYRDRTRTRQHKRSEDRQWRSEARREMMAA